MVKTIINYTASNPSSRHSRKLAYHAGTKWSFIGCVLDTHISLMVTSLGRSWLLCVILAMCHLQWNTYCYYVLHTPHQGRSFLLTVLHLLIFLLPFLVILLLVFSKKLISIANYESLSTSLRLYVFGGFILCMFSLITCFNCQSYNVLVSSFPL
jgi:hypothetical protein